MVLSLASIQTACAWNQARTVPAGRTITGRLLRFPQWNPHQDVSPFRKRIVDQRLSRPASLLTDHAVDRFAQEVCVANVAGGLFEKM